MESGTLCPPWQEEEAQQAPPPSLKDTRGLVQGQGWNTGTKARTRLSQPDQLDAGAAAVCGQVHRRPSLREPGPPRPRPAAALNERMLSAGLRSLRTGRHPVLGASRKLGPLPLLKQISLAETDREK